MEGRRARRVAGHCRRVARPADPPGEQPAGHEPAPGRRTGGAPGTGRSRRRAARCPRRARTRQPRRSQLRLPDDLPELYADPALLERILANLLGNALRHSPAGRPPLVSASSTLGDRVELRVVDRGPGMPGSRLAADLRPIPAPRRSRQHHRGRAGPRPVPRSGRGHGRHAGAGEHPRRRTHHGAVADGRGRPGRAPRLEEVVEG